MNYRSRPFALVLAFFLGIFGAHLFYIGRAAWGWLYLALLLLSCGVLAPLLWITSLFDFFAMLSESDMEFDAKYNATEGELVSLDWNN